MPQNPLAIILTDLNGNSLVVNGVSSGIQKANPIPSVLCDVNGNVLSFSNSNVTFSGTTNVSALDASSIQTVTLEITGALTDGFGSVGTSGQVLTSTGTGVEWGAGGGGSLPTGSGNEVVATPADGSSGVSALRALVSADLPTIITSNTSGTAANLSGTPALPNGTTATTQTAGDNSTKLATTAYVSTAGGSYLPLAGGTMTGILNITSGIALDWNSDTGLSRLGAASIALGNGTQGDFTGSLKMGALSQVNATAATAGSNQGSPAHILSGQYYNGSASAADSWTIQESTATTTLASTNATETAGSVVTLVVSGNTFVVGQMVYLSGFVTFAWLNGQTVALTTATLTSLKFTDGTSHGTQASHADTGSATAVSEISQLLISQSGAAGGGVVNVSGGLTVSGAISVPVNSISWDSLGAANSAPIIQNTTYGTTFTQTTNANWVWKNTTAGSASSTNASPVVNLDANYYDGSLSQLDSWTIGSSLASGTQGISTLTLAHSGSTGNPVLSIPGGASGVPMLAFSGSTYTGFSGTGGFLRACYASGSGMAFYNGSNTQVGLIGSQVNGAGNFGLQSNGINLNFASGLAAATASSYFSFGYTNSSTATSGTVVGVNCGVPTFAPTSGTASFVGLQFTPTINQTTSTGSYTALKIAVSETSALGAANKLLDLYAGTSGTTAEFSVTNKGTVTNAGGRIVNRAAKSGNYSSTATDFVLVFTATATLTLDSAAAVSGTTYRIKLSALATGGSVLTVTPNNSKTIDGAANAQIAILGNSIDVVYDGSTNWDIL